MRPLTGYGFRATGLLLLAVGAVSCGSDSFTPSSGRLLRITIRTVGGGPGPSSYDLVIDDTLHMRVGTTDTLAVSLSKTGLNDRHDFRLAGLAPCIMGSPNPQRFWLSYGDVIFDIVVGCPFQQLHGRIVFDGYAPAFGGFALYSVRPDGTDLTVLVDENLFPMPGGSTWLVKPRVSPDGRRIAGDLVSFGSGGGGGCCATRSSFGVWPGDSFTVHLLDPTIIGQWEQLGDWSPDGSRFAVASDRDGSVDLYVVSPDGTSLTRVTNDTSVDVRPSWAPGGTQLAFDRDCDIYTVDTDGSHLTPVTSTALSCEFGAAWSPAGTQIAFSRKDPPDTAWATSHGVIIVGNSDGTGQRVVASPPLFSSFEISPPRWSPDGQQLAFGTAGYVWVVNADGTGLAQIGQTPSFTPWPDWSP